MDVMLLQEFRGVSQVPREQFLRYFRARLRFAGFEAISEKDGCFHLKKGNGGRKTVLAFEADPCGGETAERDNANGAALLRVMDEFASWENVCGEVIVCLSPAGQANDELCAVRIELDPSIPFGSAAVVSNSAEEGLYRDCVAAASVAAEPNQIILETKLTRIRIGYANSGSQYRIHPLAMERVADVTRELLRLRHTSSY